MNLHEIIKRRGFLYIKTDDKKYMKIIKKEITKTRFATSTKKSLFDKTLPNTKFQKLFLKEKKKIYSLKLQKK